MPTRSAFDEGLKQLEDDVMLEGTMVERQIERALTALRALDQGLARRVVFQDMEINQLRRRIEEHAIELIATEQPVASDLRIIIAMLSISVDLERMGDHAAGIGKIVLMHEDQKLLKPLVDLPRMAEIASGMLRSALDALVGRDVDAAHRVIERDDEMDALYDQVYRELLTYMLNDPRTIDRATWLLWAGHNLERIADRATNIADRVEFLVTGHMEGANA